MCSLYQSEKELVKTYEQLYQMYRSQIQPAQLNALHWYQKGNIVDLRYKTVLFDPPGMSPRGVQKDPVQYKGVFEKDKGIWSTKHDEINKYGVTNEILPTPDHKPNQKQNKNDL